MAEFRQRIYPSYAVPCYPGETGVVATTAMAWVSSYISVCVASAPHGICLLAVLAASVAASNYESGHLLTKVVT